MPDVEIAPVAGTRRAGRLARGVRDGLDYLVAPGLAALDGARHAFSTRLGGGSAGPYASLNLGRSVEDEPARVAENRRRFLALLGIEPAAVVSLRQVHSAKVVIAEAAADPPAVEGDALLTATPGLALFVLVADCCPILAYDPVTRTAAAIHAGWRGTLARVLPAALSTWQQAFGANPADIRLAVGPAVGRCCYHLPADTVAALAAASHAPAASLGAPHPRAEGQWLVDLATANALQAMAMGVPAQHIELAGICTACTPELCFSYRRDGQRSGRLGAAIVVA